MLHSEIKQIMVILGLTVSGIAKETGYEAGDVTVCLQQRKRPHKPLRLLIENYFESEFKRLILARVFTKKDLDLLLVLLDLSPDSVAGMAECSPVRVDAWMVGGPVPPKILEKIAEAVSGRIKEKLFDSSLEAATV